MATMVDRRMAICTLTAESGCTSVSVLKDHRVSPGCPSLPADLAAEELPAAIEVVRASYGNDTGLLDAGTEVFSVNEEPSEQILQTFNCVQASLRAVTYTAFAW